MEVQVYGDGHCLYRAFAVAMLPYLQTAERNEHGLLNAEDMAAETRAMRSIRERVADHMEENWDYFSEWIVGSDVAAARAEGGAAVSAALEIKDAYIAGVRGSEWGGHLELYACAKVLGLHLHVHDTNGRVFTDVGAENETVCSLIRSRDEAAVEATGNTEAGGHYNLLVHIDHTEAARVAGALAAEAEAAREAADNEAARVEAEDLERAMAMSRPGATAEWSQLNIE